MSRSLLFMLLAALMAQALPAMATADRPIRAVIDVRSTHSDGRHSMRELALMARTRGIQVLAYTEHDRTGIRFGLEPIPGILGYTKERPSLFTTGLGTFFDDLRQMRNTFPHMTFLAGTESTPSYYWTGMPLRNVSQENIMKRPLQGLILHDADRHMITLGEESPGQVKALPSYNLRLVRQLPGLAVGVWGLLALCSLLVTVFRHPRLVSMLVFACASTALFFAWTKNSDTDADAVFISKAREQGLFTIWAHPGTRSGMYEGPAGVQLDTPPYSQRVFREPTADAFAAKYGDTDNNTIAGGLWDRYLMDYMKGRHKHPIWGVSAGDFHYQDMAGERLGNYPMDIWAGDRSPGAILQALRQGHMVAWMMSGDLNIGVRRLYLQDVLGTRLIPGDERKITSQATLYMDLMDLTPSAGHGQAFSEQFEIIVDGQVVVRAEAGPGAALREVLQLAPGPHVIRVRSAHMEANPFLVHVLG